MLSKRNSIYKGYLIIVLCQLAFADTAPIEIMIDGVSATVKASSELKSSKTPGMYSPDKAFDGDNSTAWVEGAKGTGEGEWIELSFRTMVFIKELSIVNGYTKSETHLKENCRLKTFNLLIDDKKAPLLTNVSIDMDTSIQINQYLKSFRIVVVKAQKGSKYDDMCIAGILPVIVDVKKHWDTKKKLFADTTLNYSVSRTGVTVTSAKRTKNSDSILFDTTIRSFSDLQNATVKEIKIVGLEEYKVLELTIQYAFDRDVYIHLLSGYSALFFHMKSISSDGQVVYSLKQPIKSFGGKVILEFTGNCTYPECDNFQENINYISENGRFKKE